MNTELKLELNIKLNELEASFSIFTKDGYLANFENISELEVEEMIADELKTKGFEITSPFTRNDSSLGDEPRWDNIEFLIEKI